MTIITVNNSDKVQVEISSHLLSNLLDSGLLHGGDCKCLNANAKAVIWQSLLISSTQATNLGRGKKICA